MIQAPGSAPLNADIVQDLTRLNEVLLGDWPLHPPEALAASAQVGWWTALHALHGTDAGNYFEQRATQCRLYLDVFQMRLYGPLMDNERFENALSMLTDAKGRAQFMREALSMGYHAATVDGALGLEIPQPETFDDSDATGRRAKPIRVPSVRSPLGELLHTLHIWKNDQLAHEIHELRLSEGFEVHPFDWGVVLDNTFTKMVFSWDLMRAHELGLGQRLFTDWSLYGEREPRLQALRSTLINEDTPLELHCTTSDARTVFIQFEVSSSLPAAQAFGRWFHDVYLPEVFPLQTERAMDPAFHYPLTVFPR